MATTLVMLGAGEDAIFLLQQHHPTGAAFSLRADPAGAVENKVQWNLKTYLIWSNFVDLSTSLYEIATEEKHIGFGLLRVLARLFVKTSQS
jgi:hypothetical protein